MLLLICSKSFIVPFTMKITMYYGTRKYNFLSCFVHECEIRALTIRHSLGLTAFEAE